MEFADRVNRLREVLDDGTGRPTDLGKLAPQALDLQVQLADLPPEVAGLQAELLASVFGRLRPAAQALPVLQDPRDDAAEEILALLDPSIDSLTRLRSPCQLFAIHGVLISRHPDLRPARNIE